MGEKRINNRELKKKKKSDASVPAPSTYQKPVMVQPELVKKRKSHCNINCHKGRFPILADGPEYYESL